MAKLIMIWDISTSKQNLKKKKKESDENKDKED